MPRSFAIRGRSNERFSRLWTCRTSGRVASSTCRSCALIRSEEYVSSKPSNSQLFTSSMTVSPSCQRHRSVPCATAGSYSAARTNTVASRLNCSRQLEGVNLRARAMARQKVVNRVKNPHASPVTAPRLPQAADCVRRNRRRPESRAPAIALRRTSWRPNGSRERSSRRGSRAACGQGRCSRPSTRASR